jgi:hypothetical protein
MADVTVGHPNMVTVADTGMPVDMAMDRGATDMTAAIGGSMAITA